MVGIDYLLFRQKNTLDRANRTLRIDAWNESFSARIEIQELCMYTVHPENPEWTCFEQSADLDIKSFFGFEGTYCMTMPICFAKIDNKILPINNYVMKNYSTSYDMLL